MNYYKNQAFLKENAFGGFPISGLFMVCKNQEVVEQHHAKVYGKAAVGAPPMSVPHLDTRFIDNKKSLLLGRLLVSHQNS
ncbi:malate:quinone oxidoreductase [Lysinibacillus sphaericus]